jgi:hypothetical protein
MWERFSTARAVQSQTCASWIANNFVSVPLPPKISHLAALELVRRSGKTPVPVATVGAHVLGQIGPRGNRALGPIGNWFDRIARQYDGTEWWVTEAGLHIEKTGFAIPLGSSAVANLAAFDQLAGRLAHELWRTDLPKRNTRLSDEALGEIAAKLDEAGLSLQKSLPKATRRKVAEVNQRAGRAYDGSFSAAAKRRESRTILSGARPL